MKIIRKRLGALTLFMLLTIISFGRISYAHEMYYKGSQPVPLRWHNVDSRKAILRLNGSYLRSDYQTEYASARAAWPNASQRVQVLQTSVLAQADVVMATYLSMIGTQLLAVEADTF